MYRIHQIKLNINEPKDKIPDKILKKIGGRDLFIRDWEIVRESIDARDKNDIKWVYSVDFNVASRKNPKKNLRLPSEGKLRLETAPDMTYRAAVTGGHATSLTNRPVVVGLGPAGLFCGLVLAQAGYRPLIIERGKDVERRHLDVERFWNEGVLNTESNVQFGEGGAGTFSDGKLTTGIKDVRIRKVLEEMVSGGAPKDILYKQKPHIGTDLLRVVVKEIREKIISLGGEVRFETKLEDVLIGGGCDGEPREDVRGIRVRNLASGETYDIPCEVVVLALGHSARDTFRMLFDRGIAMTPKPFSIGVRIEHPQDIIDIAQYGKPSGELGLPVAEYKLNHRCAEDGSAAGRGVYTFCMCPGGHVIMAASQEGGVVTNGMSYHDRDSGIANSALLCDVRVSDFFDDESKDSLNNAGNVETSDYQNALAGVAFQEKYERLAFELGGGNYQMPKSTWGSLRDGNAPNVEGALPEFAVAAFREAMPYLGKKLKGFDADDAIVTAVESRSSSPVRFFRDDKLEGRLTKTARNEALRGFYPCGEGAGYAGGITSAAVDGIKVAEAIIENWKL